MLDEDEVSEALLIHQRSYRLLLWVGEGIERGFLRFDTAHDYATDAESAAAWIREHFENIPPEARPESVESPQLERFAAFFSTYLMTSFDIVENPGMVLKTPCGCYCPLCARLSKASRLKTKKLTPGNRRRAQQMKRRCLSVIAEENGTVLDDDALDRLMSNDDLSRKAALAAYGRETVRRCRGSSSGPAVLALWRQFAWKPQGSPDPDFELTTEAVLAAEHDLVTALDRTAG